MNPHSYTFGRALAGLTGLIGATQFLAGILIGLVLFSTDGPTGMLGYLPVVSAITGGVLCAGIASCIGALLDLAETNHYIAETLRATCTNVLVIGQTLKELTEQPRPPT